MKKVEQELSLKEQMGTEKYRALQIALIEALEQVTQDPKVQEKAEEFAKKFGRIPPAKRGMRFGC